MSVEFINETDAEVNVTAVLACARFVLERMHLHPETDVAITLISPEEMERLHLDWMDLEGPTDVMSFPMDELRPGSPGSVTGVGVLGDVAICPAVAAEQAAAQGHSLDDEVLLLLTHSLLHLMGFDHDDDAARARMFALQDELLTSFLGRPAPKATTA
ncbi:rRNA maturation RNase YbeY [Falsarthrobacter nasiphocae]|uniref:Endoribonuclease YbeY n=1 Tax=Falsarthrobacter nasiphocae TaxID=189863 RepID=A0AAE3YCV2_9MICC|nr:rRNA maturation RNase YbeY [Falsarthrobacter nasiphocae]MDR6891074.1 putative rRNA maturation factor [Falsarthrobacter nasiphocae]